MTSKLTAFTVSSDGQNRSLPRSDSFITDYLSDPFIYSYRSGKTETVYRLQHTKSSLSTRAYPKVSGLSRNEKNNNDKHSLRSNIKGYGGKTH